MPDLDLDDLYQRRIKGLHSAIIEFATRAEPDMIPEQVELLDGGPALDQDAAGGGPPDRGGDRQRRGQAQRAGTGDDEHRDGVHQRLLPADIG